MEKILVTPRSYGKTNPALFEQLAEAGYEVVRNDVGGIFTKEQMIERIAPCVGSDHWRRPDGRGRYRRRTEAARHLQIRRRRGQH